MKYMLERREPRHASGRLVVKAEPERLLLVPEVADWLALRVPTIRAWILHRRIRAVRVGKRAIRIPLSEVERVIAEGTIPARERRDGR